MRAQTSKARETENMASTYARGHPRALIGEPADEDERTGRGSESGLTSADQRAPLNQRLGAAPGRAGGRVAPGPHTRLGLSCWSAFAGGHRHAALNGLVCLRPRWRLIRQGGGRPVFFFKQKTAYDI